MKPFESFMAPELEQYLVYRQTLGYPDRLTRYFLRTFDRYLKQKNRAPEPLSPRFFLQFRADLKKTNEPVTVNRILSTLRSFFQFLVRQELYQHNPVEDIPALPQKYFVPFVFTPEQIDDLLGTICNRLRKTGPYFLKDLAVYMAILLLARCGMRRSEPMGLLRRHYRAEEGTLYIENTKFHKDRLIPVPKAVGVQIDNYLAVREALSFEDQSPYLFAGKKQKALSKDQTCQAFYQAVKDIGLDPSRRTVGNMNFGSPTPHSLRHAFAINTLKRIREQGKDPQHALPVLAAYMGHRKYQYTSAYLKVGDPKDVQGLIEFAKARIHCL
jgi:integrase